MAPRDARTPLADPGALLATTHDAGDLRVRLRLTRPSDAERVQAFLEGLSPETRRLRFLVPSTSVGESHVRHFTFFDPRERVVVAATAPENGGEQIIGLANLVFVSTGLAELGIVVDDERQGRGVGKLLIEAVASFAMRRGATHLKADLLPENKAMLRLMEWIGPTVRTFEDGGVVGYARLPHGGQQAA